MLETVSFIFDVLFDCLTDEFQNIWWMVFIMYDVLNVLKCLFHKFIVNIL